MGGAAPHGALLGNTPGPAPCWAGFKAGFNPKLALTPGFNPGLSLQSPTAPLALGREAKEKLS